MRCVGVVSVLLLSASAAWAAPGSSHDRALAQRLVLSKHDSGYSMSMPASPCPLSTTATDAITARATGDWGSVQIGLWSTAAVAASPDGAKRLYERVVASQPACLLRSARQWGKPAHSGYKTHPCKWASIRPFTYSRYGDATRAWRATYDTRYRTGCTVLALDGVVVRTGRAVAVYLFANARALGRTGAQVTALNQQWVRRAVNRAAAST